MDDYSSLGYECVMLTARIGSTGRAETARQLPS